MTIALYPGTFDPIHNGHIDIARRAATLFEQLVIAVYDLPPKRLLFDTDERLSMVAEAMRDCVNVRTVRFNGLTVECARTHGAQVIIRGLRAISDFEFEFQMAHTNQRLAPEIEVCCFMTDLAYAYLSSSILKEVASLGGDIRNWAPPHVCEALIRRSRDLGDAAHTRVPIAATRE